MLAANLAPDFYFGLRDTHVGGDILGLHLDLSLGHWAADGLLAVFFFLVGLELKREFVTGDLRDPQTALVPVVAAIGGVAVPALIFVACTFADPQARAGWAIPAATDIAFALAVLAVIGSHLPAALRTFLLTLAVADDLIAITIIAFFYSRNLQPALLLAALVPIALFALIAYRCQRFVSRHWWASWVLLVPLAVAAWALTYSSGVHATVAGVLLALCVPVRPAPGDDAVHGLAETLEHRVRPFSAGVAVPVFAFFSAGVTIGGLDGFAAAVVSPIGLGVILGLVVGKAIGISGATWLVTRLRHANLDPDLAWVDVFGLAVLGGIGFTVSLLVSELSFGQGTPSDDIGKVAILTASVLAAALAALLLGSRNRHYRAIEEAEQFDADADGIPDKFPK
jgi:NhaA family Na+:H+ antiporter